MDGTKIQILILILVFYSLVRENLLYRILNQFLQEGDKNLPICNEVETSFRQSEVHVKEVLIGLSLTVHDRFSTV